MQERKSRFGKVGKVGNFQPEISKRETTVIKSGAVGEKGKRSEAPHGAQRVLSRTPPLQVAP